MKPSRFLLLPHTSPRPSLHGKPSRTRIHCRPRSRLCSSVGSTLAGPASSSPSSSASRRTSPSSPTTTVADALTDAFGRRHRYLRISLTERCNLRCTYCMPPEGVKLSDPAELLTTEEMLECAELFASLGVNKIRLTGGEPTLRKDIVELLHRLSRIPGVKDLGLTTNGVLLKRYASAFARSGLRHLNISLDTLDAARFARITQRHGLDTVLRGIREAQAANAFNIKLNCVVQRGVNEDEIPAFVAWTKDADIQVRFLEFMPFAGNSWSSRRDSLVPYAEMLEIVRGVYPSLDRVRGAEAGDDDKSNSSTAKVWRVPGFRGTIGFITAMSDEFCSSCDRLRLTADGSLKTCLFGVEEVSLRDVMRRESSSSSSSSARREAMIEAIAAAVKAKHERLGGFATPEEIQRARPMILIGG